MKYVKETPAVSKVEACYFRKSKGRHLSTKSNNNIYDDDDYRFNKMLLDEIDRLRNDDIFT